jgi:hypothetical protein
MYAIDNCGPKRPKTNQPVLKNLKGSHKDEGGRELKIPAPLPLTKAI